MALLADLLKDARPLLIDRAPFVSWRCLDRQPELQTSWGRLTVLPLQGKRVAEEDERDPGIKTRDRANNPNFQLPEQ